MDVGGHLSITLRENSKNGGAHPSPVLSSYIHISVSASSNQEGLEGVAITYRLKKNRGGHLSVPSRKTSKNGDSHLPTP